MIKKMTSDAEIMSTYDTMKQLRTHVAKNDYLQRVKRQQEKHNYYLAAVIDDGVVRCVAGYRLTEALAWGRFLYVDDLITDESGRSRNYGRQMMEWLLQEASNNGCEQIHLDSGVQRHAAHRFYLRERMDITCYHFQMPV
jgi:GNAT superfamily N-acetyltransferase